MGGKKNILFVKLKHNVNLLGVSQTGSIIR